MNRICPQCKIPLKASPIEGVELDLCHSCHGSWFDYKELYSLGEKQVAQRGVLKPFLDLAHEGQKQNAKRNCPNCTRPMKIQEKHGVELDFCQICGGMWFDGGELARVLKTLEEESQGAQKRDLAGHNLVKKRNTEADPNQKKNVDVNTEISIDKENPLVMLATEATLDGILEFLFFWE